MHSLAGLARRGLNGLYELSTGRTEYVPLDEEHYRQRILVTISAFWMLLVLVTTVGFPLFIDMKPAGKLAANFLFFAMATVVTVCLGLLRATGNRTLAVNTMLGLGFVALAGTCFVFGGTASPTYPLMLLAPALASIVGSTRMALSWGFAVLAFWIGAVTGGRALAQARRARKEEREAHEALRDPSERIEIEPVGPSGARQDEPT